MCTPLSMIARRTLACRPMSTPSSRIESCTWAKLLTRVLVPRIERSTVPPETIEPWQTMLSSAWPRRAFGALFGEHELRRRKVGLIGADRPPLVVHVQQRIDRDQVHVGLEIGVQRAHVAPVGVLLAVLVAERKGEHAVRVDDRGNDVAAEIVDAARPRGVEAQLLEQEPGGEDVDAHRGEDVLVVAGDGLGHGRLFLEADDPLMIVDFDDAEVPRLAGRRAQGTDGQVGLVGLVEIHQAVP